MLIVTGFTLLYMMEILLIGHVSFIDIEVLLKFVATIKTRKTKQVFRIAWKVMAKIVPQNVEREL